MKKNENEFFKVDFSCVAPSFSGHGASGACALSDPLGAALSPGPALAGRKACRRHAASAGPKPSGAAWPLYSAGLARGASKLKRNPKESKGIHFLVNL